MRSNLGIKAGALEWWEDKVDNNLSIFGRFKSTEESCPIQFISQTGCPETWLLLLYCSSPQMEWCNSWLDIHKYLCWCLTRRWL